VRVSGAIAPGVFGAVVPGRSICAFFIWTEAFAGGSGRTVMRAVSFFGLAEGGVTGMAAATEVALADWLDPKADGLGSGKPDFVLGGGAGLSAWGGRGGPAADGLIGGDIGPFAVSGACDALPPPSAVVAGGRMMGTVSFVGSVDSAMRHRESV